MSFTIMTFGQIPMLWNVLNAIAAAMTSGWILSAAQVGGLIGLTYILAMFMTHGFSVGRAGAITATWGMIFATALIPTTVWVQNIFTGATQKVDHVPLLVSAPYSLITAVGQNLFTRIDGSLSSVNGSYISVSQYGLLSPIQILMSMRNGTYASSLTPDLYNTLVQSMADCAPGGTVQLSNVMAAPDVISAVTQNYRQTGVTTWYDTTVANGSSVIGCSDVGSRLETAFQNSYNTINTKSPATSIISRAAGTQEGKSYTFNDYQTLYNSIVGEAFQSANVTLGQTAAQAAITSLTASTIDYTLNCMQQVGSIQSVTGCEAAGMVNSDTAEQFKNDAVQNASFFTSIMYSSMGFLTFLFFAMAPIVVCVCLLWPMHSGKLFMSYLMFGMWVSSWAIFYAPMGLFIQSEVQNVFSAYAQSGAPFSIANYSQIYADLSSKLAFASHAVASIPLLSLAVLSGSFFSLNSIAKGYSGERHSDSSVLSNRMRTNAALMQGAPETMQSVTSGLGQEANAASISREITVSNVSGQQSAQQFGIKKGTVTKQGVSWTDREGNSHSVTTQEMEQFKQDYSRGTELGYTAQGLAASMVLSSQYRNNLEAVQKETGLNREDAGRLVGNLSYRQAQLNHEGQDVAGMLAGNVGKTDAEKAENKAKAEGWVRNEAASLFNQKTGMAAIVAQAIVRDGVQAGVNGSVLGKADISGITKGLAAGGFAAWKKAAGDINTNANEKSALNYAYGHGYTKTKADDYHRAQELTKNLSAEATQAVESGSSYTITGGENGAASYKMSMDQQGVAKFWASQSFASRDAAFDKVLQIENGHDERLKNAFKAQMRANGLKTGNSQADMITAKLTALTMLTGEMTDYGSALGHVGSNRIEPVMGNRPDYSSMKDQVPEQIGTFSPMAEVGKMGAGHVDPHGGDGTPAQQTNQAVIKAQAQTSAVLPEEQSAPVSNQNSRLPQGQRGLGAGHVDPHGGDGTPAQQTNQAVAARNPVPGAGPIRQPKT